MKGETEWGILSLGPRHGACVVLINDQVVKRVGTLEFHDSTSIVLIICYIRTEQVCDNIGGLRPCVPQTPHIGKDCSRRVVCWVFSVCNDDGFNINEQKILSLGGCTIAKVTPGEWIWNLAIWEDSHFLGKAAKVTLPL